MPGRQPRGSYAHLQPHGRELCLGPDGNHQRYDLRRGDLLHDGRDCANDRLVGIFHSDYCFRIADIECHCRGQRILHQRDRLGGLHHHRIGGSPAYLQPGGRRLHFNANSYYQRYYPKFDDLLHDRRKHAHGSDQRHDTAVLQCDYRFLVRDGECDCRVCRLCDERSWISGVYHQPAGNMAVYG